MNHSYAILTIKCGSCKDVNTFIALGSCLPEKMSEFSSCDPVAALASLVHQKKKLILSNFESVSLVITISS